MNFLAHLHLAEQSGSSLVGNLLGDFVRGDPSKQYHQEWSEGIRLHRFVDSYTDSHPSIKALLPLFAKQRRFAPIALDVFWDHCLINQWSRFHPHDVQQFCLKAQLKTHPRYIQQALPVRYQQVVGAMWDGKWLESYAKMDNIQYALHRMSLRSPRMAPLQLCYSHLEQHYNHLNQVFLEFYPELIEAVRKIK
ncbi:acyl carrier protein phosphodiesterase [Vibrio gallicus]|uniref:acyl carrier protein phosphodiesterase n=1 Tax=Vibrio gallicus TaxID=190897 RepID=UPI0021C301A8|nr:ACP phosphodiesterase [Vibrio gallicus]